MARHADPIAVPSRERVRLLTIHTIECCLGDGAKTSGVAAYVMSVADRPSAFAQGAYYTDDEVHDEGPAVWHGTPEALGRLGLEPGRAVERQQLVAALLGQHVESGEQVRRPGARTVERDGEMVTERVVKSIDLTFSVPKSVSVLWSQATATERAAIEADVFAAARETIDHMATSKACVHRRNEQGVRVREPAAGVAAAMSLHVTARRAEDDFAPSPQLHIHSVVVGVLRSDGRLATPDPWHWFRDNAAREGGALGRAVLAERLAERGYAIESDTGKHHRYFELRGVPASLREVFSGRSREVAIRAKAIELATGKKPSGAALAVLAKETRTAKTQLDHDAVTGWWDALAAEHGFTRREAGTLRSHEGLAPASDRELGEAIMRRIAGEGPTVSVTEARCLALECAAGRGSHADGIRVIRRLTELGMIVLLEHGRVTTRAIRDLERSVVRTARQSSSRRDSPLAREALAAGVAVAESHLGAGLDDEQHAAVETLCDGTGWANLAGRAGTGKGPVLHAVAAAHRQAGWQILACAVDGTTAQRLAHQVDGRGYTIDGLVTRVRHDRLVPNAQTLIIVDEASKVDTPRWAELARLSADHGVRIVAVGDTGQLDAIQLPGMFAELQKAAPTVELTELRRHRDPADHSRPHQWLGQYQALLHKGHGHEAVSVLEEHNALRLHDTRAEAMVAMVDDWDTWRHDHAAGETLLLVHGSNDDVDTINVLAQARRAAAGELGSQAVPAPDRDYELREGDRIILRNAPLRLPSGLRLENGTPMRVEKVHDDRFITVSYARPGAREPAVEQIDLTRLINYATDNRQPVLRLAYATHPNPAQGATVARSASLGHPTADRNASYVADTRARFGHTIHLAREDLGTDGTDADRLERFADTISASRAREATIAFRERQRKERDSIDR